MGYTPIEDLLPKSGYSVYRLARMAANRALELSEGKPCLIKNPSTDKFTTTALEEIAEGKVVSKHATEFLKNIAEQKEKISEDE